MNKKILAVASFGGHWKQLQRLDFMFSKYKTYYVTTNKDVISSGYHCYYVIDANKNDKFRLIALFFQSLLIFIKTRPDIVITTGAAPGFMMVLIARIFNKKSIWIDSIANADELSLSGKLSKRFSTYTLSQWRQVAEKEGVLYKGGLL